MKKLSNSDYKLLKALVGINQVDMAKVMYHFIKKYYDEVTFVAGSIIAKGNIPIGLVAHMDTVFNIPPKEIYYDREQGVIWSPEGLGADDRAGIMSIIKIIQSGHRPHIILTRDEEKGAVGAQELVAATPKYPYGNLKYLIQLDRRGKNDCVFYSCDNPEFVKYVESFGFKEQFGSYTDISILCPTWGMAGVNLSVGYVDEHSYEERLFVKHFLSTIEKVKNMLEASDESHYYKYIEKKNIYITNSSHHICARCFKPYFDDEMLPVISLSGVKKIMCIDCIVDHAMWCDVCGDLYEVAEGVDTSKGYICKKCKPQGQK